MKKEISQNTYKRRLLKLAKHLENGKLGHEKFDFREYNMSRNNIPVPNKCGYMGCAIGECPIAFPNEWKFGNYGPILISKNDLELNTFNNSLIFFNIINKEFIHLFIPSHENLNNQYIDLYGGKVLFGDATKEEVASNIREFVKIKFPKSPK